MLSDNETSCQPCYEQLFLSAPPTRQIRRVAGPHITKRLVSAFVLSRLDYCNAALAGLPQTTLRPQRALNAAARLVANLGCRNHITPAMKELHWLPINQRITYKLGLMMHFIHTQQYTDSWPRVDDSYHCHENWTSFGQWHLVLEAKDPNAVRWTCFQLFRTCCVELATYILITIKVSKMTKVHLAGTLQ